MKNHIFARILKKKKPMSKIIALIIMIIMTLGMFIAAIIKFIKHDTQLGLIGIIFFILCAHFTLLTYDIIKKQNPNT